MQPVPKVKMSGFTKDRLPQNFTDAGIAEAKQEMIAAAEPATTTRRGTKIPDHIAKAAGIDAAPPAQSFQLPDFATDENPARTAQSQRPARLPAAPAAQPATPVADKSEYKRTVNTAKGFQTERWRDKQNVWHGLVTYASGAPQEHFTASTLAELADALLSGKANGTLFVREKAQIIKRGNNPNSWGDFFTLAGVTEADFNAMPKVGQQALIEQFESREIQKYCTEYSNHEPIPDADQYELLKLRKEMSVPLTAHNLVILFGILAERGLLSKETPAPPAATTAQVDAATIAAESAPRKRGTSVSGIVPGRSSGVGRSAIESSPEEDAGAYNRAKELSKTPEGMAILRRESIRSLRPGYSGRRS